MKSILVVAFFVGTVFCFPLDMYVEFDIHHAPAEAAAAIPAGVPLGSLEVLLPINAAHGGPVRGFIKQDIPQPNGKDKEVFYPFGFEVPAPAAPAAPAPVPVVPAAPVAPVVPAAPVAPVVPAAPIAPVAPVAPVVPVVAAAPPPKRSDEDEEEEED